MVSHRTRRFFLLARLVVVFVLGIFAAQSTLAFATPCASALRAFESTDDCDDDDPADCPCPLPCAACCAHVDAMPTASVSAIIASAHDGVAVASSLPALEPSSADPSDVLHVPRPG